MAKGERAEKYADPKYPASKQKFDKTPATKKVGFNIKKTVTTSQALNALPINATNKKQFKTKDGRGGTSTLSFYQS